MWRATKAATKAGYPVKTVNLAQHAGNTSILRDRCIHLQKEMTEWLSGNRSPTARKFDGTFDSLLAIYETNPKSSFFKLKHASQHPYRVYVAMLRREIGKCRIDRTDGIDVETWFNFWVGSGEKRHLGKARTAIAVLKAAVRFGIMCRFNGCAEFKAVLSACRFEALPAREFVVTAEQVVELRNHARAAGHPGVALCYALQFEGASRQWDIRGQWMPLSDPAPSTIIDHGEKWIGPTWANVDENLILKFTPTKTQKTTGQTVIIDLRACPMVMEEIQMVPPEARKGPLVVSPNTGLPYRETAFKDVWRTARKAAGIPAEVWNRDLRKSGATEARAAAAAIDDLQKLMGHKPGSQVTAKVYDQAALEAHRRIAQARAAHRGKKP